VCFVPMMRALVFPAMDGVATVMNARAHIISNQVFAGIVRILIAILALEKVLEPAAHVKQTTIWTLTPRLVPLVVLANTQLMALLQKLIAKVALTQIVRLVVELARVSVPLVLKAIVWPTENV